MKIFRILYRRKDQRGAVAIMVGAFLLLAGIGFAAFAIDFGYRHVVQNQLQDAADAGERPCGDWGGGAPVAAGQSVRLWGRRRALRAACWHCEDTNRLFICCYDGPEAQAEMFCQALDGFKCCEDA